MHYDWDIWHGGWWMWLGMFIFWSTIIFLIIWGLRTVVSNTASGRSSLPPHEDDAVEIARKRFARGEISREEYETILRGLNET